MKVQRLFTLMLVFFVLSTATVLASSIWGDFEGYSKARVMVNGDVQQFSDSEVPAFIVNGSTVLPLRSLADSLQSLVKWDNSNKTVSLFKPNVHMITVEKIDIDGKSYQLKQPFGEVKQGKKIDFDVFTQVDNLKANISSVKISVKSPSGSDAVAAVEKAITKQTEAFWLPVRFSGVSFEESGIYNVTFAMKLEGSNEYSVVSEKQIVAK
ncbi:stalk domain-containing protein [Paenibacillus eucommiae]|uniref:Copper amine oxidase-like N-terminal domain-containing protein n=1 Tax=Paenibacillus eucommiae TaxID=1355755 RepID=A0ABS4IYP1_9BACL|nr:stalk domain-containing protein [Paenibacillus eucommiae]MBP1992707.1 hypothetical protein [Paenibacillus eucommiae]